MRFIDLHTHSYFSDGTYSPEQIVDIAEKKDIKAIALTDHDTVDGLRRFLSYKKATSIERVPGVEITADEPSRNIEDIHILGLFINHKDKLINKVLSKSKKSRLHQKKEIINNLRNLGYNIKLKEVIKEAKGEIGRPHIAKILLKNNQQLRDHDFVFKHLIGNSGHAYVKRSIIISMNKAISAIHSAGGVAFLAHPFVYKYNTLDLIKIFKNYGGDGIETIYDYQKVYHYKNINTSKIKQIILKAEEIARKLNLQVTGGSDFHGMEEKLKLGDIKVPYGYLENIKRFLKNNKTPDQ